MRDDAWPDDGWCNMVECTMTSQLRGLVRSCHLPLNRVVLHVSPAAYKMQGQTKVRLLENKLEQGYHSLNEQQSAIRKIR